MKASTDRILTTHVGSRARPHSLLELMRDRFQLPEDLSVEEAFMPSTWERVIAGADCGFSSRASFRPEVRPQVVWEKFRALSTGAEIATGRLW